MFVFSNLAISLDGKIATARREHFPLGTKADLTQMIELRKRCDAILMGAATLRVYQKPCRVKGADPQPCNVIVSRSLEGLDAAWPFFNTPDVKRILFVSQKPTAEQEKKFRESSDVVLLQAGSPIASQIVSALTKKGIKNLLVEGGGSVMWDFVSQDLIDEFNVTLTPRILGGKDAPTLVEGDGFSMQDVRNLKLKSSRVVGNEIYLVYSKTESRGKDLPSA